MHLFQQGEIHLIARLITKDFYTTFMPEPIDNLGRELLLESPAFFALIFGGISLCVGELDPIVRSQLQN
jgi:hypothetical protein